jgi:hypothetical protein
MLQGAVAGIEDRIGDPAVELVLELMRAADAFNVPDGSIVGGADLLSRGSGLSCWAGPSHVDADDPEGRPRIVLTEEPFLVLTVRVDQLQPGKKGRCDALLDAIDLRDVRDLPPRYPSAVGTEDNPPQTCGFMLLRVGKIVLDKPVLFGRQARRDFGLGHRARSPLVAVPGHGRGLEEGEQTSGGIGCVADECSPWVVMGGAT